MRFFFLSVFLLGRCLAWVNMLRLIWIGIKWNGLCLARVRKTALDENDSEECLPY